jgi:hypothetical protein
MAKTAIKLHVWGAGLGLPSIDVESIAAIAYCIHISKSKALEWTIEPGFDTSNSPNGAFSLS